MSMVFIKERLHEVWPGTALILVRPRGAAVRVTSVVALIRVC